MDFETKLAAAGETLEKLAAERGLSLNDFTEQETVDLLTTIMGDKEAASFTDYLLPGPDFASLDPEVRRQLAHRSGLITGGIEGLGGGVAGAALGHAMGGTQGALLGGATGALLGAGVGYGSTRAGHGLRHMLDQNREETKGRGVVGGKLAPSGPISSTLHNALVGNGTLATPEEVQAAAMKQASENLTYGQVMHEVAKVAAANGYDISQASPAELDDAVQKMAALLSNPEYLTKQAALQEKIAEADAMGRVMAHAYVDELGKLAAEAHEGKETEEEEEKEEEKEKAEKKASFYRSVKSAGEMPAALKEHMKKKDDEEDEEEEKKASFAKAASLRAAELLILNGVNPETGYKFASQQEALDAGAALVLQSKGYI